MTATATAPQPTAVSDDVDVELPWAKLLGTCRTCTRPMQSKSRGSTRPRPGVLVYGGNGRCDTCAQRLRRRAQTEAAEAHAAANDLTTLTRPTTAGLPPADVLDQAVCAQTDPDLFFPDDGGSTRAAKSICAVCPVQAECLQWALATNQRYGVWGGLSERQRRTLRTRRAGAA